MSSGTRSKSIKREQVAEEEDELAGTMPSFGGNIEKFSYAGASASAARTSILLSVKQSAGSASARSPSPKKRKRESSSYAPPSKYAHLNGIPDQLDYNLICVMIGLNPGISTAMAGHAYANPSNLFWKMMYFGGLSTNKSGEAVQLKPHHDEILPSQFDLGNTNIVSRPTKNQAELTKTEMDDAVAVLEDKIRHYKPESVNIIGKAIWESIWRAKHEGKNMKKEQFKFGFQDDAERMGIDADNGYEGAKVFVVPSTSGLVAGYSMDFKKAIWSELGAWVNQRRRERALLYSGQGVDAKVEEADVKVEDVDVSVEAEIKVES